MATRSPLFDSIKVKAPKRNKFNLSFSNKLTMDYGMLVPVMCKPVCPGDAWRVHANIFMRFMPMTHPVMHNCNVYIHYFFVPYDLLWDKWQEFITGGPDGTSAPDFPVLPVSTTNFAPGKLADFLGFPKIDSVYHDYYVSAMPFKAYNLIYNEYYRDQNLTDAINIGKVYSGIQVDVDDEDAPDGKDFVVDDLFSLKYRAWEKDYFTSALPFAQRGPAIGLGTQNASVQLKSSPTGGMKVVSPGGALQRDVGFSFSDFTLGAAGTDIIVGDYVAGKQLATDHSGILQVQDTGADQVTSAAYLDPNGNLVVNGTLFDINQLRNSMRLQEWLEKNARGGGRYSEQLLSHFGVVADDQRLGRPQYLGGGVQPVVMSEVTQTTPTETSELGNWAGNGFSYGSDNGWTHYFKEHGLVMAILSVLPRSGYHQGIPREWTKFDKLDFMWPEFANLGEQPIYNKEIFYAGDQTSYEKAEDTFGYTPRYAEYKFSQDEIHGEFKTSMLDWHLNRTFGSVPALSESFVEMTPDQASRIFAVTADDNHIMTEVDFKIDCLRELPVFGTPTF